ncbi:MAG: hypothetical protein FWC38_01120 [Proteobacteria bacterium]|nr:hypothetical protein [Pseudomonadota bacterium]
MPSAFPLQAHTFLTLSPRGRGCPEGAGEGERQSFHPSPNQLLTNCQQLKMSAEDGKMRLKDEEANELLTNSKQLKISAEDGKVRLTDVADAKQLF